MLKKYKKVLEKLDWNYEEDGTEVTISQYSPAGEDFSFTVPLHNLLDNIKEYADDFDEENHVLMWIEAKCNNTRGVPSLKTLVKDAEAIQEMLDTLVSALEEA